jgi:SAM-dependent methyltransferase
MDRTIGEDFMNDKFDGGLIIFNGDWIDTNYGNNVGEESRKTWEDKIRNYFFLRYMSGTGLDIGGAGRANDGSIGNSAGVHAILPTATIIDTDYPGYDGKILPFADNSQDYCYSSHCLEHISDYKTAIQEQFRVTKQGGHIIIVVPHKYLYERKETLPSRWNGDHKRFYTPASLLAEIEESLVPNTYRVRHMQDNDKGHTYGVPVEIHANGQYEIEVVIQKL